MKTISLRTYTYNKQGSDIMSPKLTYKLQTFLST